MVVLSEERGILRVLWLYLTRAPTPSEERGILRVLWLYLTLLGPPHHPRSGVYLECYGYTSLY
jgi:hypothetical protein